MIFVSCLIKPIFTHLKFTQAFSFMSYYPPKNVDFHIERCHVLFSTKGCFTRESLCERDWHQQNASKAWECNIFFLKCSKNILQFGFVCCWKIWCKFFFYWCQKYLLINLFLFGYAKNAKGCWVNYMNILLSLGFEMCILYVEDYFMG